jgi:hypothetical protein
VIRREDENKMNLAVEPVGNSVEQPERREVVGRMLKLAAAAPMAALLFDPRSARADSTGGGIEEP